ncbi:multidrug effflux MFS transporter [Vibrio sp. ZSDE26]|uniref:Multidrug effflux MFS transporter n=1 Tax=Vibrio amylolyticus TaxID=2847292 RepID=A0A9X2BHL0_9VIBR|nr:multidrug effflux MFS transporter [Vibrio amylolyticus]MCK6264019.1 multidrug effflux MFS transporter [Vibrio amylolyticus]
MLLAIMIIATGQVGVSIYLPALPAISESLLVSQAQVQTLVTLFLIGFGASQLFYGPLSDAIGRRPVFLFGQGIYLLGTVVCFRFSDQFEWLEIGRLLQGLGAGSASVLGRSVLRDSYEGAQFTKALSYLSITASILPIVSPVIGGAIAFHFGWQAVFSFVLVYLCAIYILGWLILPETLPYKKKSFNAHVIIKNYARLLVNPQVISSASYNWFTYLAAVVTLSILPFILQNQLGLTVAEYGAIMIIPSAGLLVGSVTLNILTRYYSVSRLLSLSFLIIALCGVWLSIMPLTLFNVVSAFTCLTVAQGLSFPLSIRLLLSPHKHQAGAVSALSGSIQMVLSGVFGGFLVQSWVTDHHELGYFYMTLAAILSTVLFYSNKCSWNGERPEPSVSVA